MVQNTTVPVKRGKKKKIE